MPAFTPQQQTVLLEFARFALSHMANLRGALTQTSARLAALEELLLTRRVVTKEDLGRVMPQPALDSRLDEEREAAYRQVLRRILAGDGAADAPEGTGTQPPRHPDDRWYTSEHLWVKIEDRPSEELGRYRLSGGRRVRLGITAEGRRAVGERFSIDLPRVGTRLRAMDTLFAFRTSGTTTVIVAPVSGEVVAVNEEVTERIEQLLQDPYDAGWLVMIAPTTDVDTTLLLSVGAYETHVRARSRQS